MNIATLQFLPQFILDNLDIKELLEVEQLELNKISEYFELLRLQTSISFASIYLDRYEQIMAMDVSPSLSNEERIGRILAKLNTRTTATPEAIKTIVRSFTRSDTDIEEHYNDYSFLVFIKRENNQVIRMKDIRDAIDAIKPAHLTYQLSVRFPVGIGINFNMKTYHVANDVCGDTGMSGDYVGEYPHQAIIGVLTNSKSNIYLEEKQWTFKHKLTGESPQLATVGTLVHEQVTVKAVRKDYKGDMDTSDLESGIYPIISTIGNVTQILPVMQCKESNLLYEYDMGTTKTGTQPHIATLGVVSAKSGLIEAELKSYTTEVSFTSESDFDENE